MRWIEVRGRDRAVSVSTVPLDLAPILREDLFKRAATTVVTSATLADRRNVRLSHVASRARRSGARAAHRDLPSPFKYREQAMLAVPSDVPAPNVNAAGHFSALSREITSISPTASNGGMFVLFTSHRDVRAMAAELRARGVDRRWPLLVHGDETRDALLARFRDAGRRDPARHGVVLGRRRRAGRRVARAADREAAVPRADRADHGGALRGDRRRAAATRSASTCFRMPRCGSSRASAASSARAPTGASW